MPKYKLLTKDQLQELEKEFIEYLVINGITADDWSKIKQDDQEKASKIIELFSDVVFEHISRKTHFMQMIYSDALLCYQFLEKKMIMVGLKSAGEQKIDFGDFSKIDKILKERPAVIQIVQDEFVYNEGKERAVIEWLEKGAVKSDGSLFKTIYLAYVEL